MGEYNKKDGDQSFKENRQTHKTTEGLLQETQQEFAAVLAHPVIPAFMRERLTPVVETMSILDDVSFHTVLPTGVIDMSLAQLALEEGEEVKLYGAGVYVYPLDDKGVGTVHFRESAVRQAVEKEDGILFLAAEELSHALHSDRITTPLAKIKNKTVFFPHGNPAPMMEAFNRHRIRSGKQNHVREADILVVSRGFTVLFVDKTNGYAVHSVAHTLHEESRAAIVATILTALDTAIRSRGAVALSPEEELAKGFQLIEMLIEDYPEKFVREEAALQFILPYCAIPYLRRHGFGVMTPESAMQGVQKLLREMGTKTYAQFVSGLSKTDKANFVQACETISIDYLDDLMKDPA